MNLDLEEIFLGSGEIQETDKPLDEQLKVICGPTKKYLEFPNQQTIDDFMGHCKNIGYPETYEGLSWEKAAKEIDFEIVAKFSIGKEQRKGDETDMIPCPMCSIHASKFRNEGFLIWNKTDLNLFIIGPRCGENHFQTGNFTRAQNRFNAAQQLEHDIVKLAQELPLIPAMIESVKKTERTALKAQRLLGKFDRTAPTLLQELRQITSTGTLRIVTKSKSAPHPTTNQTHTIRTPTRFSRIDGSKALHPETISRLINKTQFDDITHFLLEFPADVYSEEGATAWIQKKQGSDELHRRAARISNYRRRINQQQELYSHWTNDLRELGRFLNPMNLRRLVLWSDQPDKGSRLTVNTQDGDYFKFVLRLPGRSPEHFGISVKDAKIRTTYPRWPI